MTNTNPNPNRLAVLAADAAWTFRNTVLAAQATTPDYRLGEAWNGYYAAVTALAAAIGVTDEDAIAVLLTALTAATSERVSA